MVKIEIESPNKRYITCNCCKSKLSFLPNDMKSYNEYYDYFKEEYSSYKNGIKCPACGEMIKVEEYSNGELKKLWKNYL